MLFVSDERKLTHCHSHVWMACNKVFVSRQVEETPLLFLELMSLIILCNLFILSPNNLFCARHDGTVR